MIKILVLLHGQVLESANLHELLSDEQSYFTKLVSQIDDNETVRLLQQTKTLAITN